MVTSLPLLSAGSDPISEGRRIYIGNLDYNATRFDIKKLLRAFFVYNTVEKIYMPYTEPWSSGPAQKTAALDKPSPMVSTISMAVARTTKRNWAIPWTPQPNSRVAARSGGREPFWYR